MTTGEMLGWTKRFNEIMSSSQVLKRKRLKNMHNDLSLAYKKDDFYARQFLIAVSEEID